MISLYIYIYIYIWGRGTVGGKYGQTAYDCSKTEPIKLRVSNPTNFTDTGRCTIPCLIPQNIQSAKPYSGGRGL